MFRILVGEHKDDRPLRTLPCSHNDTIVVDHKESDRIILAEDRDNWRVLGNTVTTPGSLSVSQSVRLLAS